MSNIIIEHGQDGSAARLDRDKITAMRKLAFPITFLILIILVATTGLSANLPAVQNRVAWRVDRTMTYLRNALQPAGAIPTALPQPRVYVTRQPTGSPTAAASGPGSDLASNATTATLFPTPTPTIVPTPIPQTVVLTPPKWEKQDINGCGPTSLAMYLRFYGWEGDQKTISALVKPYREDRNVNVEELIYYVRTRAGWLNIEYRVGGELAMLKQFIAAGIPVMIEESFKMNESYWPNDDRWAAHYLLITGYNDASQTFIGQDSFRGPDQVVSYTQTDELWQSFNRVFIIIYRPEQADTVKNILGPHWDVDYNRRHALDIARAETEADSQNAYAWFNLGTNLTYFDRYTEAAIAYDTARNLGLPQRMLRYQFGPFMAYFHSGRLDDVLALVNYSLIRTNNSEEAFLWQGWAFYRQGKTSEAIGSFQMALKANPFYQDAQYALDYIMEHSSNNAP